MSFAKFTLAAFVLAAAGAASAEAGTVTSSSGPFRVNGTEVTLEAGKTIALKKGDVLDTGNSTVKYKSDTGDEVQFDAQSVVREEETTDYAAGAFILKGSATGVLSEKTQLGVAAGWVNAPKGGRAKVLVEAARGRENSEALFRAIEGNAWIRYRAFSVSLLPAHSVTLDIDPAAAGTLCFRTGQQNAGEIEIQKTVAAGEISIWIPKATIGCVNDEASNKTKICDDINSLKTAKIRIHTKFVGKPDGDASIGPGTCALIDNATGAIEVLFSAVKFEILERAISLTSEFSTLAQSNFSDVK